MKSTKTVKTTLGDLIVNLTDETVAFVANKKEAYKVVGFMLANILNRSRGTTRRSPKAR